MINELLGIQYNIAKANVTDRKVQNLASYINVDSLKAIHKAMDKNKASGIDKVTKEEYEQNLEENLENLVKRMRNGSYRPNPTRRVYIPKETKGKLRPLGISSYEDKLVENAIAQIPEQIYEPKFYNESFGFRPNRNCHQAVREIIEMIQYHKTNYVVEADIRGFFDSVDHDWLLKMLKHDTMHPTRMSESISINISEAGFEAMKNDPEYEAWVLNDLRKGWAQADRWAGICGGAYSTIYYGATKEECHAEMWRAGYQNGSGKSLFDSKAKDNFWERRVERKKQMEAQIEEQQEKKRIQKAAMEKSDAHKRLMAQWEKEAVYSDSVLAKLGTVSTANAAYEASFLMADGGSISYM